MTAALVATLLAPAAAHAATPLEIAVQDDGILLRGSTGLRAQAWQRIGEMRASYVRVNLYWNDVVSSPNATRPPRRVRYSLRTYDRLVSQARAQGVRVHLTLSLSAPAWATSNRRVGKTNPSPELFAAFARDMAKHFKGRVARYSILNEPNLVVWLKPKNTSAAQYRRIYARSYTAIKRVDPSAKVFLGETAPFARQRTSGTQPLVWLKQVLNGARLTTDGYAHHPYGFKLSPRTPWPAPGSATIASLGRLVNALDGYARRGSLRTPTGGTPGIYLTEHGYFVNNPGAPAYRSRQSLPAGTRARYWTQSLDIASRTPTVRQLLSYQLYPLTPTTVWDTSILDAAGNPTAPFAAITDWVASAPAGTIVAPG